MHVLIYNINIFIGLESSQPLLEYNTQYLDRKCGHWIIIGQTDASHVEPYLNFNTLKSQCNAFEHYTHAHQAIRCKIQLATG